MKKKIITILGIILIVLSNLNLSFAVSTSQFKPTSPTVDSDFISIGGSIISVIQYVGIILGTVVITVIGIKYMLGSVEEKAEYKQTMMPYLVGSMLLMGSSVIVGIIAKNV